MYLKIGFNESLISCFDISLSYYISLLLYLYKVI